MLQYLSWPIETKAVDGLALEELIGEVSCLPGVVVREVGPLDGCLFRQELVSDFVSTTAVVGSLYFDSIDFVLPSPS
jgi:hypothetical protein